MSLFIKRKRTDYIAVHCTATKEGEDFHVKDIDRMHRQRGFNGIGYHYLVALDGTVEQGRPQDTVGAHVSDYNSVSVGVSYVGGLDKNGRAKDTRTTAQKASLKKILTELKSLYPKAKIQGHRDFPQVKKECPCFNAIPEYKDIS